MGYFRLALQHGATIDGYYTGSAGIDKGKNMMIKVTGFQRKYTG